MARSLFEPEILERIIKKKEAQLREIQDDLGKIPLDDPSRPRWLERGRHLAKGIPELKARYEERVAEERAERVPEVATAGALTVSEGRKSKARGLVFRRGKVCNQVKPGFDDSQLLHSYDSFRETLTQVRALIKFKSGQISPAKLKKEFARSELGRAVDDDIWTELIEAFSEGDRAPGEGNGAPGNVALFILEKMTGYTRNTLKFRLHRARRNFPQK